LRVKRTRFKNILKNCPNCNSSRIVSNGVKYYCEKCSYTYDPFNEKVGKCIFVTFDVKSEKELFKN